MFRFMENPQYLLAFNLIECPGLGHRHTVTFRR
jgi:hypothetical protein